MLQVWAAMSPLPTLRLIVRRDLPADKGKVAELPSQREIVSGDATVPMICRLEALLFLTENADALDLDQFPCLPNSGNACCCKGTISLIGGGWGYVAVHAQRGMGAHDLEITPCT